MASLKEQLPNATHIDAVSKDKATVIEEVKESVLSKDGPRITILHLPPKGSPSDMDIKPWTEFYLTDAWVQKATADKIPYPKEYFICSHIEKDAEGKPIWIRVMGSGGGGYSKIASRNDQIRQPTHVIL